ncbi:MAG: YceI family protein [Chitinophaga sp.]|uniref:YceI family protein n=1 Tax=Chitinophaga sp. TaxID=1869181 RepID=UPI0025BB527A|nr:YceI family protein [Chitinophaga sp.]MBV8252347.1 YceI family protein [Chitinophaga sp.]
MQTQEVFTKTKWAIDTMHSQIGFKIKHLMFTNVRGSFTEYAASIYTTGYDFLTAEIDFWINPASINTNQSKRDEHLKSADFFDVEQFKEITFRGNTYEKLDNGADYYLYGDLTIKGITKRVKLYVEFNGIVKDPWGNEKAVFNIEGKINRKEWGLNWNAALEAGGLMVGDDVLIDIEVQLTKEEEMQG